MDNMFKMKLIVLSVATKALKMKEKNPSMSDNEIVKELSKQAEQIIKEAH